MTDIDGAIVHSALKVAQAGGYTVEEMKQRFSLSRDELRPGKKVPWARYMEVADGLYQLAGSDAEAITWARTYADHTPRPIRAMLAATLTPQTMMRIAVATTRQYYRPLVVEGSPTGRGYAYTLRVRDGFSSARAFLVFNAGATASMTQHLGLPDMPITWAVSERVGHYDLVFPDVPTLKQRVRAVMNHLTTSDDTLLREVEAIESNTQINESPRERALRLATLEWKLTARQVEALGALIDGASNKEISTALGCSPKTAEHHVTAIIRAAQCQSRAEVVARLWQLADAYTTGNSGTAASTVGDD